MRRFLPALTIVAAVVVAAACAGGAAPAGDRPTIRIGSTNFTEQLIVGELYAQALEAGGYKIERKFNLGAREVVVPALESGQIDLEVDYLATLLVFLDKDAKGSTDAATTAKALEDRLKARNLVQFAFAPAVDQNGIVVTKETAARLNLKKVSDLTPLAKDLVFGGPPTCPNREFCAIGLEKVYGITFKTFRALDTGGPLTVTALEGKQIGRVQAVRARRDTERVEAALQTVREQAATQANLMPALLDCARAHCTEGEIVGALQDVWGAYTETPVF